MHSKALTYMHQQPATKGSNLSEKKNKLHSGHEELSKHTEHTEQTSPEKRKNSSADAERCVSV